MSAPEPLLGQGQSFNSRKGGMGMGMGMGGGMGMALAAPDFSFRSPPPGSVAPWDVTPPGGND